MTRTKLWRLSLTAILGFGWLFLTPAYSDDPLSLAAQEIDKLNASVSDLNYKTEFQSLIDDAELKYSYALEWKNNRDGTAESYDAAVAAKATALDEKNLAQSAVDNQTTVVATALTNKNNAQDALDVANLNLSNTPVPSNGGQGVAFQIYPMIRNGSTAVLPPNPGLICQGAISTFYTYAGDWAICGASQNMIGIFTATLTVPNDINDVYFAAYTDDGSRIYVDGILEASQWQEQGSTWGPYTRHFNTTTDKTLQLEVWWYNGGGPGVMHLGWGHSGIWSGIPSQFLSYGQGSTQTEIDAYNEAVAAQQSAQATYDDKLSIYNQEVQTLQNLTASLTTATQNLTTADQNLTNALDAKNNAAASYNQSIIDLNAAIDAAWKYYEEQMAREIATALAQAAAAAANQPTPEPSPQPTEEVTPEPTPEPSPEQTKPVDPTPEPSSDTTDEPTPEPTVDPEPTPEPSPEPSPLPSDIDPEPTPEPEPTPAEPSEEPSPDNNIITDEELLELIPEKGTGTTEDLSGVIANLTSKDNKLVKLSPEQVAAVSQTLVALTNEAKAEVAQDLGIKSTEVAVIAEAMKSNPELATAFVEFKDREAAAEGATMPYTLADATTEVQTEAFLSDPIGALTSIDFEKILSPSEWGKDMTDDQREKAQEVIVPVIIAGNIVAAAMTRRI